MSATTSIEWTDRTWNPTRGCTKISPGCKHCYAETFAERWRGLKGHPYEQGFDLRLVPSKLDEPLRWKKPSRIFVNSMSDLFHEDVPDEYIAHVFGVMCKAFWHTFQVLTKRADRMAHWVAWASRNIGLIYEEARKHEWPPHAMDAVNRGAHDGGGWPLRNVWLGVSVENQEYADERIPQLLRTLAAVRFLSCEPLLGRVRLDTPRPGPDLDNGRICQPWFIQSGIDWVIVGGESGPGARPMRLEWARSIVQQCKAAGVPVFVKQLGANPIRQNEDDELWNIGISRKGGEPAEWPADLRVREFPAR